MVPEGMPLVLLFLLLGSIYPNLVASISPSLTIPSNVVMSYPETFSGWETTITWGDGTTETITVNSTGHIFLGGSEGIAFGFVLILSGSQPSTSVANNMLDWCQSNGVRFMSLIFHTSMSQSAIESRLDFWIPKLYDHKMFVILWPHPMTATKESMLDATDFKNKFQITVDKIVSMNRKEMVVAFIGSDEWDLHVVNKGISESELQDWFNDVDTYIRNYLSTNSFERPVGYSVNGGSNWWAKNMSYNYSDFIFQNSFTGSPYESTWDSNWNTKKGWWNDAGMSAYQAWLPSFGYGVGVNGDNSKLTPEYFAHHLAYPELSMLTIWYLWEGWYNDVEEHYMFDLNGNPYNWTELLAPYFPR